MWDQMKSCLTEHELLLGCLETLFAHVCGASNGLSPTDDDIDTLETIAKRSSAADSEQGCPLANQNDMSTCMCIFWNRCFGLVGQLS